jgi:hypothetical protein
MIDLEETRFPHQPYVDLAGFVIFAAKRRQLWTVAEALTEYAERRDPARGWREGLATALRRYKWDEPEEADLAHQLAESPLAGRMIPESR